jgi:hypothetical protein
MILSTIFYNNTYMLTDFFYPLTELKSKASTIYFIYEFILILKFFFHQIFATVKYSIIAIQM